MPKEASQIIVNRYQLIDQLGAGAMGAVFRATDRLAGEMIALKQIALETQDLQFASRGADDNIETLRLALATEFKTLASLRHPHIISVIDYGFDQQRQPYFTMDYLPDAQSILEASADKSIEEQVDLLIQTLSALAYLHRRGILHRDIKPGNVLVTNGNVRVLDFGLSIEVDAAQKRAGTLIYMAPEMLRTSQASESSDLYAVGVLAYEMWAGQHPYDKNSQQLVMDILERDPDVSLLPEPMQPIIARLLAKDPADRFSNADQLIQAFSEAIGQPSPPESATIRESFLQAATFVGREAELDKLTNALGQAINGQGSSWLVGGESGVGKSRLLDELRTQALVSGAQVLHGQAVEGGGQPYHLWRESLRRAALSTALNDLAAGVVKPLVPDIESLLSRKIPASPELGGQAGQQRLVLMIAEIFLEVAKSGQPLVLILEDIQWCTESLEPLKALNRLVSESPILIVGSYRSEEQPDLPNELPEMSTIPLSSLDKKQIAELSFSMLGEAGEQQQVLDLLQKETEGNTFFLVETVRALAEEAGRLDAVGGMALPEEVFAGGVQQLLQRRLARVPQEHRTLLKLAAVTGRALDMKILQSLAASSTNFQEAGGIEPWLTTCANLAVLNVKENQWRFAHDKLRAELLDELTMDERPYLYRQAAEAYEGVYPADPSYASNLADHWEGAGVQEKTCYYARIAGDYAAAQYANDEAVRFFSRALALTPSEDKEGLYELHLAREKANAMQGAREAQAIDLKQLTILSHTPIQQIAVALLDGTYQNNVGEYTVAIGTSERAYQWALEIGNKDVQAQAMITSGQAHLEQGDYETANLQYQLALSLAQAASAPTQTGRAWSGLGKVAFRQGDYATAAHYYEQTLHLWQELNDRPGQMESLQYLGQVANAQGEYETARDHYLKALQLVQQMGDRPHEGRLLLDLGESDWRQGAYVEAETYLQQSLTLAQTTGDRLTAAASLRHLGMAVRHQGQNDRAIGYFKQSLAIFQEIGNRAGEGKTLNNLGTIADEQRQYAQAIGYYKKCLVIFQQIGDRRGEGISLNNMGNVADDQRQYDRAIDRYEESLVIAREIGDRDGEGRTLNNLGWVSYNQGQYDKSMNYYEQSLVIRKEIGDRYGEGITVNNLGVVADAQGQMDQATGFYEHSLSISQEIGNRYGEGETLNNLGAVALARSAFPKAQQYYQQSLAIRQEINQPQLVVEDWAGLALVALQQGDDETANTYADQLLTAWVDNTTFEGAESPMRALHFLWQVCDGLELIQTNEILAAAAGVMQSYLDNQLDPEMQTTYLKQPHHQPLWAEWQALQGKE